ncbi:MAG: hypothetical protein F4073_06225 [Rhodobacteraceae bacterium]|nr:hypothetical protein [Paracoccaceae bacterium]MYF46158.1 hypothetical protein [Paracoccaceae bacterium]MYI91532.1 hypothetical protein [Paracoccaceae bacterium]
MAIFYKASFTIPTYSFPKDHSSMGRNMKNNLLILSIWFTASFVVMTVPGTPGEVQSHTVVSNQIEWNIPAGTNLRIVLRNWSKTAGWNLIWEAPREYYTRLPVSLIGSFEQVIHQLMESISRTNPELEAILYRRNKVVVILSHNMVS